MLKWLFYAFLVATNTIQSATSQSGSNVPCEMDDGTTGECVPFSLCNANNSINTDGIGIINVRGRDGPCPSYMEKCCSVGDKRPSEDPITPSPQVQPMREGCGQWNKDGVGFKTTGDVNGEAKFGEFPWMVAILKVIQADGKTQKAYNGGGSLIHPSVVMTVAHRVDKASTLLARAGEWDTQTTNEVYPYQERDVTKVVFHKDYNKDVLYYDIALLILKSPFDLAPHVGVACLPPPRERTSADTRCFATGWGLDKFGKDGQYQVILKKVDVPVVEHRKCQNALRKTRLGPLFQLHSSVMCAGGESGVDTCTGDGGSPLVCPHEYDADRYVQKGIVTWGIGCGGEGIPGAYVDVSNLRTWIDDKMNENNFEPKVYLY